MLRACSALSLLVASAALAAEPQVSGASFNPRAVELFERDWVLLHWGLKYFDGDYNRLLSAAEANAAALKFKAIADGDGDGRVTPYEYDRAREFLIARY